MIKDNSLSEDIYLLLKGDLIHRRALTERDETVLTLRITIALGTRFM